jgi:hypothetical protein
VPDAATLKLAVWPAFTDWLAGCVTICGATGAGAEELGDSFPPHATADNASINCVRRLANGMSSEPVERDDIDDIIPHGRSAARRYNLTPGCALACCQRREIDSLATEALVLREY